MSLVRLNLLTAVLSLAAALVWTLLGDGFSGLIWLIASFAWLLMAMLTIGRRESEPSPGRRLARRFSRLILWT